MNNNKGRIEPLSQLRLHPSPKRKGFYALFDNLIKILQDFALKDIELADKLGVTAGYLSQIKQGPAHKGRNIGHNTARKIEHTMKLPYGWLDNPQSMNEPAGVQVVQKHTSKAPKNSVPLVSWEYAHACHDPLKIHQHKSQFSYIPCPGKYSKYAYALKLNDNTMQGEKGKTYPKNAIVFVDPLPQTPIQNGDCIIAKIASHKSLKLRILVRKRDDCYLQALKAKSADIRKEFEIFGKLIGTYIPE